MSEYNKGFTDGYTKGRLEVLFKIKSIFDNSKYPEYLEEDISDYLDEELKEAKNDD